MARLVSLKLFLNEVGNLHEGCRSFVINADQMDHAVVRDVHQRATVGQSRPPLHLNRQVAPEQVPVQAQVQTPVVAQGPDDWQKFLAMSQQQQLQAADLAYGAKPPVVPATSLQVPDFMATVAAARQNQQPNFNMLQAMKGFA